MPDKRAINSIRCICYPCNYVARVTRAMLDRAVPRCGICGMQMTPQLSEEKK